MRYEAFSSCTSLVVKCRSVCFVLLIIWLVTHNQVNILSFNYRHVCKWESFNFPLAQCQQKYGTYQQIKKTYKIVKSKGENLKTRINFQQRHQWTLRRKECGRIIRETRILRGFKKRIWWSNTSLQQPKSCQNLILFFKIVILSYALLVPFKVFPVQIVRVFTISPCVLHAPLMSPYVIRASVCLSSSFFQILSNDKTFVCTELNNLSSLVRKFIIPSSLLSSVYNSFIYTSFPNFRVCTVSSSILFTLKFHTHELLWGGLSFLVYSPIHLTVHAPSSPFSFHLRSLILCW